MSNAAEDIKKQYERRYQQALHRQSKSGYYEQFVDQEREHKTRELLAHYFTSFENVHFLEVGAGQGGNLPFFNHLGIPWANLNANELLPERILALETYFPNCKCLPGNVFDLTLSAQFDIIYQSTVFTSILNTNDRIQLAKKMWQWLKPNGIILWYDFAYNNPNNPDVRKVNRTELESLFPLAKNKHIKKLTLAPPIGRRVGRLYPFLNWPILQTHLIGVFQKA